jgi:hypothetical protein
MLHMVVHAVAIDNWDCCCMDSQLLHKQWLEIQGLQACHQQHRKPWQHLTCCCGSFKEAQETNVKRRCDERAGCEDSQEVVEQNMCEKNKDGTGMDAERHQHH